MKLCDLLDDEIEAFIIEKVELFGWGSISNDGIFLKYLSNLIVLSKSHNLNWMAIITVIDFTFLNHRMWQKSK